jgi:hypothetical protein
MSSRGCHLPFLVTTFTSWLTRDRLRGVRWDPVAAFLNVFRLSSQSPRRQLVFVPRADSLPLDSKLDSPFTQGQGRPACDK